LITAITSRIVASQQRLILQIGSSKHLGCWIFLVVDRRRITHGRSGQIRLSLQKSKIESYENQHDSDIRKQPFPKLVPEKQHIHSNYSGYHQQNENYLRCIFFHVESYLKI
jgi:hypothetical protein